MASVIEEPETRWAEIIGEMRGVREQLARLVAEGDYEGAANEGHEGLLVLGRIVGAGPSSAAYDVPIRLLAVGLYADLIGAELALGRVGTAIDLASEARNTIGVTMPDITAMGVNVCPHGRATFSESGTCMARPPCPRPV